MTDEEIYEYVLLTTTKNIIYDEEFDENPLRKSYVRLREENFLQTIEKFHIYYELRFIPKEIIFKMTLEERITYIYLFHDLKV